MENSMSHIKATSIFSINDVVRKAVEADRQSSRRSWSGATAELAAWLGVSPQTVRERCHDRVAGTPRRNKNLADACWSFMDAIAAKQRAWLARLEAEIAARKAAYGESNFDAATGRLESAYSEMANYDEERRKVRIKR
jgi:hypothetical protein